MDDLQLFVVGDSDASFWNGTHEIFAQDRLPGIASYAIRSATHADVPAIDTWGLRQLRDARCAPVV